MQSGVSSPTTSTKKHRLDEAKTNIEGLEGNSESTNHLVEMVTGDNSSMFPQCLEVGRFQGLPRGPHPLSIGERTGEMGERGRNGKRDKERERFQSLLKEFFSYFISSLLLLSSVGGLRHVRNFAEPEPSTPLLHQKKGVSSTG